MMTRAKSSLRFSATAKLDALRPSVGEGHLKQRKGWPGMAFYDSVFSALGLSDWCGEAGDGAPLPMADLLAQAGGNEVKGEFSRFHHSTI